MATTLLAANGGMTFSPISNKTIFRDTFNRTNGPLGNGWIDMHDTWPTMFDALTINSNQAQHTPVTPRTATPSVLVGNACVYQDFGVTDNFEIGILWDCTDPIQVIEQPSPAAWIDPTNSNVMHMGVACPRTDIGLVAMYAGNVFRCPLSESFEYTDGVNFINYDQAFATASGAVGAGHWSFHNDNFAQHWMQMRIVSGQIYAYIDGVLQFGPLSKPVGYPTTSLHGFNIISSNVAGAGPTHISAFYFKSLV